MTEESALRPNINNKDSTDNSDTFGAFLTISIASENNKLGNTALLSSAKADRQKAQYLYDILQGEFDKRPGEMADGKYVVIYEII